MGHSSTDNGVCGCEKEFHSACYGAASYIHEDKKKYCILHLPTENKGDDFKEALRNKLDQDDFDFRGTFFPGDESEFKDFKFNADVSFTGATFCGKGDFSGAEFGGAYTDFSVAIFSGERTTFREAEFGGERTTFRGAEFGGERTTFRGAEFGGEQTDFFGAVFCGDYADFSNVEFSSEHTDFSEGEFNSKQTNFSEAEFSGERTDFSGTQFSGELTDFSGAKFSGKQTDCSEARFNGRYTNFAEVQFGGEQMDFSEAKFSSKWTSFLDAKLNSKYTTFSEATFSSARTNLSAAEFSGEQTDFSEAEFDGERTDFSIAHFSGKHTDFSRARFSGADTSFQYATFSSTKVCFEGTNFIEKVTFLGTGQNTVFDAQSWVQFDHCRIDKPELLTFNTVLLRPGWFINSDVRKVDFTDVKWYSISDGSIGKFKDEIEALKRQEVSSPYTLLAQACQRLAANAEENRQYPLANQFHYWSMDARRLGSWSVLYQAFLKEEVRQSIEKGERRDITRFRDLRFRDLDTKALFNRETWQRIRNRERFGFINGLYWALSGYGVRPLRAFMWLIILSLVFALLYSWPYIEAPYSLQALEGFTAGYWGGPLDYLGYFLRTEMYSLGALARLNPEPKPEPGLFQTLVIVAGILGPLQVGLFLLAIRRKVMR